MTRIRKALVIALAAILVAAGVITSPVVAQSGRALFNWIIADRVLVQDGGLTVTGSSALADTSVTGTGSVSGIATFGTFVVMTPATVITMTNGATLTPLGSYQPLASAGTVGFGAITSKPAGTVLTLVNTVNQTITITDGTTIVLSGNIALGQYDSLLLISDGTRWIMRSTSNN